MDSEKVDSTCVKKKGNLLILGYEIICENVGENI